VPSLFLVRSYFRRFAIVSLLASAPLANAAPLQLDMLVSRDAVYRVSFEELAQYGMSPTASRRLVLTNRGEPVPFWLEGDDDARFGPGSSLTFVGEHLRGATSRFDEHSNQNVYRLHVEPRWPWFRSAGVAGTDLTPDEPPLNAPLARVVRTMEQDRVRVRFNPDRVEQDAEVWYWQRLSVLDREPFTLPIDLGRINMVVKAPVSLRINLRGWSFNHALGAVPDHRIEVLWNGTIVGSAEWNGQSDVTLETGRLPQTVLREGENKLQVRVPSRRDTAGNALVDVALLNWIEVEHAFDGQVESGQLALHAAAAGALTFAEPTSMPVEVYSARGERLRIPLGTQGVGTAFADAEESSLTLLAGEPSKVDAIRMDTPSSLRDAANQADYLMIAHGSLLEASRPLAEHHRKNGLAVSLIDVQDIYDEFNQGVLSPESIREFIAHAHATWQPPKPRFVLLVGDASWENHSESLDDSNYADWTYQAGEGLGDRFIKNASTSYADTKRSRNLVPTLQAPTSEGQAASDSELVNISGDDWQPDLAIGRLPVVEPGEVSVIVDKLIGYQTRTPVGPWRRSMLWIANEEPHMQNLTNHVALGASQQGMRPTKVYPDAVSADNSAYQAQLLDEFGRGSLLVHFFGHGGRYIWRTGPPDPRKNHDLFTLDHLDQLATTDRLPLILSMTCYSAPFDHPTADSIGEKFLRTENRGAVGVLAASWRNMPTQAFSEALVQNLIKRDVTVGEAILTAKHQTGDRILVQTYNYLGDPATRLKVPMRDLAVQLDEVPDRPLALDIEALGSLAGGEVMLELYGKDGELLDSHTQTLGNRIELDGFDQAAIDAATSVSLYAWNEGAGADAVAHVALPAKIEPAATTGAAVVDSTDASGKAEAGAIPSEKEKAEAASATGAGSPLR
jgi:hypothetical protein